MPTIAPTLGLNRSIVEAREQLSQLHTQLATGKKVRTYGDLGLQRTQVLSLRSELTQIKGYRDSIALLDVRIDVMLQSADRIRELAVDSRSDAFASGFDLLNTGKTLFQTELGVGFDEVAALLNTDVNGRYLYGGRETEQPPVLPASDILNGVGGRAGFIQIVDERRQADLGADGRGRLVLAGPHATMLGGVVATPGDIGGAGPGQVTIDIGGNPQTFDISDGGFDTLAALEAAIDVAFGADVASIVGGNQLQLTAVNPTDSITITEIDAGAAALAGLTNGAVANPTATATIAEDAAGSPFGFKLAAVNSTLLGTNITGPAGAPSTLDVQFTPTLPNDGQTITLTFDLPDGTQKDIVMTARLTGPVSDGEFLVAADENSTAANFQAAVTTVIETEAQRSLSAASLFAAADNFFDFDSATPPQRVDGPPFDSATAYIDATPTNTVFWYQGETSPTNARQSSLVKVDDSISVAAGARADEDALRQILKTFASVAVEAFTPGDIHASGRYEEIRQRAADNLAFPSGTQSVDDIITELTLAKTVAGQTAERHKTSDAVIRTSVDDAENADVYEVSAQILSLQSRIEASLQVSASISSLSIINFI